jgi:hypothetical protein
MIKTKVTPGKTVNFAVQFRGSSPSQNFPHYFLYKKSIEIVVGKNGKCKTCSSWRGPTGEISDFFFLKN